VVGGQSARELAQQVEQALQQRNDHPVADGALAAAGTWLVQQTIERRTPHVTQAELAARRFGFAGPVWAVATFPLNEAGDRPYQKVLDQLAANLPITRYGVSVAPDARVAAVVFGCVELTLMPIARHFAAGETLRLKGEVGARFESAQLYVTDSSGRVQPTSFPSRQVEASIELPSPGIYQVEVMGNGVPGPVVLLNVPVYVGVPEPEPTGVFRFLPVTADAAESQMLTLLNQAREEAGLARLAPDAELRAVALAHSQDMQDAHFFGHVSPTTGAVEDRARRASIALSLVGENVADADSPEAAHAGLMGSPGHRANVLNPKFTHVGIGIVLVPGASSHLLATQVFGRRPAPPAVPPTPMDVVRIVAATREARGLKPVVADPLLQAAAAAGLASVAAGNALSPVEVFAAANAGLKREARRRHAAHGAGCWKLTELLELEQLAQQTVFGDAMSRRMGAAVTTRTDGQTTWIVVLVFFEGMKCP
jgi:uncharacterized protein YkwD